MDGLTFLELAFQYLDRQWVLQFALDGPFEGASTIIGIVANLGQIDFCLRTNDQMIAALRQQCRNMPELDIYDPGQVGAAERMEDDNLIDAVQELGAEMRLQGMRDASRVTLTAPPPNHNSPPRLEVMITSVLRKSTVRP